jgi:hypothetical protein
MGKTDAEEAPTGQELSAELILAYLASGRRVNRTWAGAALSELISVGFLACRDGRYSHSADVGPLLEAADQLQARKGDRGREGTEHTRDTELWAGVYIILLDVPDLEAHGVTPSPTPCGSSDTSPGSSGSVPSAYCVASWSSSRSAIQVLFLLSCLSVCCLWCWFA